MAHSDGNTVLFERIKTVLTNIARGNTQQAVTGDNKDRKILMTEVMSLVLKPTKDQKMHQAYVDCLVNLTKTFCESNDKQMTKFVGFTYQELLKKFLGGRGASSHSLNQQFFVKVFEECNAYLGKSLMKPLLRYLLPQGATEEKLADSEVSGHETEKSGARSQHQRLLAIEIFNSLVKAAQKNPELLKVLGQNLELITSVLITVL